MIAAVVWLPPSARAPLTLWVALSTRMALSRLQRNTLTTASLSLAQVCFCFCFLFVHSHVVCAATDEAGNVATCSETVKITAVPPTITCAGPPMPAQCNPSSNSIFSATVILFFSLAFRLSCSCLCCCRCAFPESRFLFRPPTFAVLQLPQSRARAPLALLAARKTLMARSPSRTTSLTTAFTSTALVC